MQSLEPPGPTSGRKAMNHVMDRPIVRRWWQRQMFWRSGALAAGAALLVATALLLGHPERSVRLAEASVTIASAQRAVFHDFIPLRGTVTALDTVYVDAPEGGRVERLLAQAGDEVHAGQPLVQLSNTDLVLDVLDREGRLVESITELQTYQTQLEQNRVANEKALAQIDYNIVSTRRALERRKPLLAEASINQEAIDQLQDQLDLDTKLQPMQAASNRIQEGLRVTQLPQIRQQLATLQQDVKLTHATLDDLTARAPVSGRLTSMDLKVGQTLDRNGRFAVITPDTGYKLSAAIDEYYLPRVRVGQRADVVIEEAGSAAYGDSHDAGISGDVGGAGGDARGHAADDAATGEREWPLIVSRIYPQVNDGMFSVDLRFLDGQPAGLLPGEALEGKLSLGADTLATVLPAGAFLERTGGDWLFVLSPDGHTARRRTIQVGRRSAEQLEILAGLRPGERAIVSDYTGLDHIDRIDLTR
jgi:HlyD family secretion protein